MFVLLTSKWRERAAAIVVALYALCLVAPTAAFAFSDDLMPAHCLSLADDHPGAAELAVAESHTYQDGINHHKSSDSKSSPGDADHPGNCCGLFCLTAIAPPAFSIAETRVVQVSVVALPAAESLFGRSASRIDRPPRALLSL